jgi:hypothetical protein
MNHYVYDIETLANCFVVVFKHFKTDETKVFIVSKLQNDIKDLVQFLNECATSGNWFVGYNNIAFDAQIIEYVLRNQTELVSLDPDTITRKIYEEAQETINLSSRGEFQKYSERTFSIKQLDVFKLNHWDNPAKMSSLKWIQYSMDWHNVQDMPIHHTTMINKKEQLTQIVEYCVNDVASTKEIMNLSKDLINLRGTLTKKYKLPLYSASEPKIAKEFFLHFMSEQAGIPKYELRSYRTKRDIIDVGPLILPYIDFKLPEFKKILTEFKSLKINAVSTKGEFKNSTVHKNVKTDFGLGGIHGATKSGVYKSTVDMLIITSDVKSFYPNLAIRNKWSPAHLPKKDFCSLYEWFYDERVKIPKKDPTNYLYKIVLNSTYGLSNDKNSFLYDPKFTMQITINGQLSLLLLYEMLSTRIPESIPLMQNTDGLEMMIPVEKKELYFDICKEWEELTKLELEHDTYQKMIIGDVNNYIAVFDYKEVSKEDYEKSQKKTPHYLFKTEDIGSITKYYVAATKCKGRFEFVDLALHKNKSFLVIPKAIYNYFVHDMLPDRYLSENRNVLDYCGGIKTKGDWIFKEYCVSNHILTTTKLQGIIRYYISRKGCKIIKVNQHDNREIQVHSGRWLQTNLSKLEVKPFTEYGIDESFYLDSIYKEIRNIETSGKNKNELLLF